MAVSTASMHMPQAQYMRQLRLFLEEIRRQKLRFGIMVLDAVAPSRLHPRGVLRVEQAVLHQPAHGVGKRRQALDRVT